MKKIDLGQTIAILANIGIILGIFFLAFELQQNNLLLENQARFVLMENQTSGYLREIENPDLVERRLRAAEGEQLSGVDAELLLADVLTTFAKWEWEYDQWSEGFIETLPVDGYRRRVQRFHYYEGFFAENGPSFSSDWRAFMEACVFSLDVPTRCVSRSN